MLTTRANESLAESLRWLTPQQRAEALQDLTNRELETLEYSWRGLWARPNQLLPGTIGAADPCDDWLFWLVQAGRGFGKTRLGAEAVREWAENPNERILMIAPTANDVREVMVEGPSGLLSCYPPNNRPEYNSSRHLVTFPSGAIGITRSADEPERLRGPQFSKFWIDELCAWRFADEAWDQLSFGFRVRTKRLRGVITTTPKPIPVIKKLRARRRTVITGGSSYENRSNLADEYYQEVIEPYAGTRLGRQEIEGELLEDIPGALWTRAMIDAYRCRLDEVQWDLIVRIVVAIDPAVTAGENSDDTGIIVAGLTVGSHIIVIDDLTCKESPLGWARVAVSAYRKYRADRIVGEVNNGGDLVEGNIRGVAPDVPFRAVRASRGKAVRAEPVAALYEQGRVHHVGSLTALEDQLCSFVPGMRQGSPDRMDALVWAITELLIDQSTEEVTVLREIEEISSI
jgi:phage terminase large subunit-like protein